MKILITLFTLLSLSSYAVAEDEDWIIVEQLRERTCEGSVRQIIDILDNNDFVYADEEVQIVAKIQDNKISYLDEDGEVDDIEDYSSHMQITNPVDGSQFWGRIHDDGDEDPKDVREVLGAITFYNVYSSEEAFSEGKKWQRAGLINLELVKKKNKSYQYEIAMGIGEISRSPDARSVGYIGLITCK